MGTFDFIQAAKVIKKAVTPREVSLLDEKAHEAFANSVGQTLVKAWVRIIDSTYLEEKIKTTLSKWSEVLPAVYSFSLWRWFINVRSDGSVLYKNSNKTRYIARLNSETGIPEFNSTADEVVAETTEWQSKWIEPLT